MATKKTSQPAPAAVAEPARNDRLAASYDVLVVGGGHNGLTCAAYLAKEGKTVAVIESRSLVGGYCTSEENVSQAPGFVMNPGGIDHMFTHLKPSVIDELGLERHGLEYIDIDPLGSYLATDGRQLTLWRDVDRTCKEIARYSSRDAERYRVLVTVLADVMNVLAPYMMGHPKKLRAATVATILRRAFPARKSLKTAMRLLMSSPTAVLDEWFESEEVKSALIAYTSFSMTPVELPGIGLSLIPIQHRWGLRRPVGGSGAFTQALARCVEEHGGVLVTGSAVNTILVEDNRVRGVLLEDGREVNATTVVGALEPAKLFTELLDPKLLPEHVREELRGLQTVSHNIGCFRADIALKGRPEFPHHPTSDERVTAQAMFTSYDDVRAATRQAMSGELPDRPPVTVWRTTAFDKSLVPEGSGGESLYLYPVATPSRLAGGRTWAKEKDAYLERCIDVIEEYSPGIRDLIIGVSARCPDDFPSSDNAVYHADMLPWQMGPWRPTPSLSGYKSPIGGLWHTGAGAHPVAGICGWSGRTAARTILADGRGRRFLRSAR